MFKGGTFVDNLTIDDFEVYEDGKLQKIEAVYLIKKTKIERKEEKKKFTPETNRHFYLFFQITEYTPRIGDALSYFFQNVLIPRDSLTIVTPLKTYRMKSQALEVLSKEEIVNQLKGMLRGDAMMGSWEYRNAIYDMVSISKALGASISATSVERQYLKMDEYGNISQYAGLEIQELIMHYAALLNNLDHIRSVDQQRLMDFAKYLKDMEGQKYVFLFYQREFIPQIEPRILAQYGDMYQDSPDVALTLSSLFGFYRREISVDINQIRQDYADSSISAHFLFFTKPAEHISGIRMTEHSEDIFATFMEMAKATGGSTESSANPSFLFKRAAEASENYYLLYYAPLNYKRDGKFKNIRVKVKGKSYKVTHRAGYFAN